ncbi:MAG: nucleotidyltransferase domain-containing protein [candidate division KSB1 bacterium]
MNAAVIRAVCERLVQYIRPNRIILFGSRANGTARKDSDIDLLIVVDSANPLAALKTHDRYGQILNLFPHRGFGLDAFVFTDKEIEKLANENEGEWDLILEILQEGKILYGQ